MLLDLALIRIIEPASKLRSFELLEELFGIKYSRLEFYRHLEYFVGSKNTVIDAVTNIAKNELGFNFSLVFYDVTSLYFEAFGEDELRKPGFSKDGKSNQPQILIGLVVNDKGFPIAYEIFEGNKFEGKTIIPVILAFKQHHQVKNLTVVADAAMISRDNVTELKSKRLHYIVGARLANLPTATIERVSRELGRKDGTNLKIRTKLGSLVVSFSLTRYKKDKREMEKQIVKAESLLKEPGKIKRAKFLQNTGKSKKPSLKLNETLIKKTKSLLGIKGYYTNLGKVDNQMIIQQYHDLWHVEHAFRIAKSDLQMRPIHHFKKQTIEAHVLICFIALSICRYMELKTNKSIKKIIQQFKKVTDAKILNTMTDEITIMRSAIPEETMEIVDKLNLSH